MHHSLRSISLAFTLVLPLATSAHALDVPNLWVSRFSGFQGDLSCKYGDPDCNRCVHDVEGQFRAITQGPNVEEMHIWRWENNAKYDPGDSGGSRTVESVLTTTPTDSAHYQGFARSPSASPNMLATYAGPAGGVFLIDGNEKANGLLGKSQLEALHDAKTVHPGGVQGIGQYFVVANYESERAYLEFFDAADPLRRSDMVEISDTEAASVAGTRLAGGGYLFATTVDSKKNGYRFWYTPSLDNPHIEPVWQDQVGATQPSLPGGFVGFEGISFVTECGTGDTYMVGINGSETELGLDLNGDGVGDNEGLWALYRLSQSGQPKLTYVTRNFDDMHFPGCNTRAGGSAFAGKWGELGLYCSQKAQSENQRIYGLTCGASTAYLAYQAVSLTGLLPPIPGLEGLATLLGAASCTKAVLDNNETAYTEFWPAGGSPETPPEYVAQNVRLDVRIDTAHAYGNAILAVDETPNDPATGLRVLTCTAEASRTCTFYVKRDSVVHILTESDGAVTWLDNRCGPTFTNVDSYDPGSTLCAITVSGRTEVQFEAWNVI